MTKSSTVFLSGGTGSFGRAFTKFLLDQTTCKVRIFSRDEAKHEDMARTFPAGPRVTYVLGDIRNRDTLARAVDGCWAIVHAAALKRVWAGELYADEFARTNVNGTINLVDAALEAGVSRSLLISSDKAVAPVNAYGASKKMAESIFTQANIKGVSRNCIFSSVRGGNVWNSAGSVWPIWQAQLREGMKPVVTDPRITRFHLFMPDWVRFCWGALDVMRGGEIFAPIAPAWNLGDLAEAAAPGEWHEIGERLGDKLHECLVPPDEAARTIHIEGAYIVEPSPTVRDVWAYQPWDGPRMPPGWAFTSDTACRMSGDELIRLVRKL